MAITVEDFIKTATDEQKNLLINLAETSEQEASASREIGAIYASIEEGVYSKDCGRSITPCKDEDDAIVISAGPRQRLNDIKERMKI